MSARNLLREPLLHFLVIGAAMFLFFHASGGGSAGPGSTRIVVTPGQIAHLEAGFTRTWSRAPSEDELKTLLDEWVREEIAVREAMGAGLDRDDTVIRRRLRQKLEFLIEDAAVAQPPTDDVLKAWLDQHAEQFRSEPRIAFRQVLLKHEKRGASVEADAAALLERLKAAGSGARIDQAGDATMLPGELHLTPLRDVEQVFGGAFVKHLETIEPGQWAGPVRSGYGLHLVLIRERIEGGMPGFEALRPLALREVLAERRRKQIATMYDQLLQKYTVVVERAPTAKGAPEARTGRIPGS
jgi:hypothetical protein